MPKNTIKGENVQNQIKQLEKLCAIYGLDKKQGYADTHINDVKIFKISSNEEMMPLLYNRGFSFIGQGKKVGFVVDKRFEHNSNDFLIITSPQPIECETFVYDKNCMMGIYINLDMSRLHKISSKLTQLLKYKCAKKEIPFSVITSKRTSIIEDVYARLLNALLDPVESEMVGSSILDELYYRILQSENGYILRQLCEQNSSFARVSKVVEYLHANLNEKISIEEMAEMTDMSVNNFHRVFKEAINDTPIQYIKKIRLSKARQMILYNNMKAVDASYSVGYDSPTQFSREFKRYFGVSPSKANTLGYENF